VYKPGLGNDLRHRRTWVQEAVTEPSVDPDWQRANASYLRTEDLKDPDSFGFPVDESQLSRLSNLSLPDLSSESNIETTNTTSKPASRSPEASVSSKSEERHNPLTDAIVSAVPGEEEYIFIATQDEDTKSPPKESIPADTLPSGSGEGIQHNGFQLVGDLLALGLNAISVGSDPITQEIGLLRPRKGCGKIQEAQQASGPEWDGRNIEWVQHETRHTDMDSNDHSLLMNDVDIYAPCIAGCTKCGNKHTRSAILAGDQAFCAACFNCRNCERRIEDLRYIQTSQGIFCMDCGGSFRIDEPRLHLENGPVHRHQLTPTADRSLAPFEKLPLYMASYKYQDRPARAPRLHSTGEERMLLYPI
jgi:hypothetical protein